MDKVLLNNSVRWVSDTWVPLTYVCWENCSPNLRVKARRAGYCPAEPLPEQEPEKGTCKWFTKK